MQHNYKQLIYYIRYTRSKKENSKITGYLRLMKVVSFVDSSSTLLKY